MTEVEVLQEILKTLNSILHALVYIGAVTFLHMIFENLRGK